MPIPHPFTRAGLLLALRRWARLHSGVSNPGHPRMPEPGRHYLSCMGYDG